MGTGQSHQSHDIKIFTQVSEIVYKTMYSAFGCLEKVQYTYKEILLLICIDFVERPKCCFLTQGYKVLQR